MKPIVAVGVGNPAAQAVQLLKSGEPVDLVLGCAAAV